MKTRKETRCMLCKFGFLFALEGHHIERGNPNTIVLCKNCHCVITIWAVHEQLFAEYYQNLEQDEKLKLIDILSLYERIVAKMLKGNKVKRPELGIHITAETTGEELVAQSKEKSKRIAIREILELLEKQENEEAMKFGDMCLAMAELGFTPDQINKGLKRLRKWGRVAHPKYGYWKLAPAGEAKV